MAPKASAYDDDELSISFSSSHIGRNAANAAPDNSRSVAAPPSVEDDDGGAIGGDDEPDNKSLAKGKATQRFGPYDVIKTLGEGSFGKVKLAIHRKTGQKVALKIIARKKLVSRDMAGRVEREIEYLTLLRHPHIIKLYNVVKTQTEIVMVLEYAGGELFDYIVANGRMKESLARRFFQQVIDAVEYCHRHKIVHRDLKPENLLLDGGLNVKIADFGLSNIMTDGNFLRTSCGSPNYAAPEVIGGKLYAGPEVDVWSCGVILYVLLVGRLPFDDEHIPSLFAKIARGSYIQPAWMPTGPAALIKKMLVVNPVQRATIEDIRQDPWFNKDLPLYLHPKQDEFLNTGVDPKRAIRVSDIAPRATIKVQERLHNEVKDKISKTIGVGKQDVQDALDAEEPSAIKDAYLLVRENKMMEVNPADLEGGKAAAAEKELIATAGKLAQELGNNMRPSLGLTGTVDAMAERTSSTSSSNAGSSAPVPVPGGAASSPGGLDSSARSVTSATSGGTSVGASSSVAAAAARPYTSRVGILPSSIPDYHKEYMEREKLGLNEDASEAATQAKEAADDELNSSSPAVVVSSEIPEIPIQERSPAEKEEAARRLKPHSRGSQMRLSGGTTGAADGDAKSLASLTPVVVPGDQLAVPAMPMRAGGGANQLDAASPSASAPPSTTTTTSPPPAAASSSKKVPKPTRWQFGIRSRNQPFEALLCIYKSLQKLGATWYHDSDFEDAREDDGGGDRQQQRRSFSDDDDDDDYQRGGAARGRPHGPKRISTRQLLDRYSLPADPWVIKIRWTREDILKGPDPMPVSTGPYPREVDDMYSQMAKLGAARKIVCMHMKIQIYDMDAANGVYLVDFMCDGYETADGRRIDEKDVMSPFPFLDQAARLIMQLAEQD